MTARIPTDELHELIAAKRDILEQLRELARRQSDMIAAADMTRLLTVLAAKDTLLRRLMAVERKLDPFRHDDPEARRWRSPEDRRRCRHEAERCETLLGEILLLEKQGERELTARRDDVAARLQQFHTASEARRAYHLADSVPVSQLDLTSEG